MVNLGSSDRNISTKLSLFGGFQEKADSILRKRQVVGDCMRTEAPPGLVTVLTRSERWPRSLFRILDV